MSPHQMQFYYSVAVDNMLKIPFSVICVFSLFVLGNILPQKRKRALEETPRFNYRLGIPVANKKIIQQYEKEHKMMYREKNGIIDEVEYLAWPSKLGEKNLTEYCRKYLRTIIPNRQVYDMIGHAETVRIMYSLDDDQFAYNVGAIRCEVPVKNSCIAGKVYYVTETPEPECVYTMKRIKKGKAPFKIVFKVCGFENNDVPNFLHSHIKLEDRRRTVSKIHKRTGIPIAPNHLIAEYEYKHQLMYKKHDGSIDTDRYKVWPLNRNEKCLSEFCTTYLRAVVPNKIRNDRMPGNVEEFELHYTQNKFISLQISIIRCAITPSLGARKEPIFYYITESPEPDCVYTLLRSAVLSVCKIVHQICGIKSDKYFEECCEPNLSSPVHLSNEWERKSDFSILGNMDCNNSHYDGTKEGDLKPNLKSLSFSSND